MANKAYKYRLYPNNDQQVLLAKFFGCARFVYNKCLEEQERRYANGEKYASYFDLSNYIARTLKKEYAFLCEVDKFALTNAARYLSNSYKRMFKHQGRHPRFKSKRRSRQSYTTNIINNNIKVLCDGVRLPKLGKVKAVIHRVAPEEYKLKSATVTMERDDSYYVSVLYEYDAEIVSIKCCKAVGLDYKSDGLFVSSDGEFCDMPRYFRQSQPRLAKAQKKLKQSTETANRYDVVCVEDLDMRAMSNRGFGNGKATLDNGYGMFRTMLDYKLHDRGKILIKAKKCYPSSQICSSCGHRKPMPLKERVYRCSECGAVMDRDLNAAINIRNEGLRLIS